MRVVAALEDCNQRGGRMLSIVDLVDAGTVDMPLAAYLAAAMQRGASLLVGASPGGAGKTTVMCALLNFLPRGMTVRVMDGAASFAAAHSDAPGSTCHLAHEIGAGNYYAYIWGASARALFALAAAGHTVASNLHADTLEHTYAQLCGENAVPRAHVQAVALKLFISVAGRQRRVVSVYECTQHAERLVWQLTPHGFVRQEHSRLVTPADELHMQELLATLRAHDARTLAAVRHWLENRE